MTEKLLHIESLFVFEHKVNGATQFVGIDTEGLAFIVSVK
jgi:hypothetical protein